MRDLREAIGREPDVALPATRRAVHMSTALAALDPPIIRVHMNQHAQPELDHARCGSRTGWAVCQTHPQAERWARDNLTRQGFTTYLPLHSVIRRDPVLRTMTRHLEVALFTSYLFVIPGGHWSPICHTQGIRRLLMSDGKPHLIPDSAVTALQATEALRQSPPEPGAQWQPGSPCRIAAGAFRDHDAVVLDVSRHNARVALLCFGQMREMHIPTEALAPRSEP
jgi:transcriptional antiterminator RfaH